MPEQAETSGNLADPRTCLHCGGPLPATATPRRVYCSPDCRFRHYVVLNPGPRAAVGTVVPLHWHVGGRHPLFLAGDIHAGYHRGDGCPPGCEGPGEGGWSTGIPVGREGLGPPDRPPSRPRRRAAEPTPIARDA